jgi:hypothetical protein
MKKIVTYAAVALIATLLATFPISRVSADPSPAHPHAPVTPHGWCDEAWQAPQSAGASDCRKAGWIVNANLTVTPGGRANTVLPRCTGEDERQARCYWDARRSGNGRGHGFIAYVGRTIYVEYVNGHDVTTGPDEHRWYITPWVG